MPQSNSKESLNQLRQRYRIESEDMTTSVPDAALKEIEKLLREWSERVTELGAQPKGYFTVDFQSVDPELLYCWTYGEDRISFGHKVWENFTHRRRLGSNVELPADHLKWVN